MLAWNQVEMLHQFASSVLDTMAFIDDNVLPLGTLKPKQVTGLEQESEVTNVKEASATRKHYGEV